MTLWLVLMTIAIVPSFLASCSSKRVYSFNDPDEAMSACREKLHELKGIRESDIDDLSETIKDWVYLRDSSYMCIARKMNDKNEAMAFNYFKLADSIRNEINRIASLKQWTMADVLTLKIKSNVARDSVEDKQTYKDAMSLFNNFKNKNIIRDKNKLIRQYDHLLTSDKSVLSNATKIRKFLEDEDLCFRSLMIMLPSVKDEELIDINNKTTVLFENLYNRIEYTNGALNEYLSYLLSIRFNRRIIQNAKACINIITSDAQLTESQKQNFRWMLIQPYTVLDDKLISVLSKEQKEEIIDITKELPSVLSKLQGDDGGNSNSYNLSDILSQYLLKYYLNAVL